MKKYNIKINKEDITYLENFFIIPIKTLNVKVTGLCHYAGAAHKIYNSTYKTPIRYSCNYLQRF